MQVIALHAYGMPPTLPNLFFTKFEPSLSNLFIKYIAVTNMAYVNSFGGLKTVAIETPIVRIESS
jgi:hypothetical protein